MDGSELPPFSLTICALNHPFSVKGEAQMAGVCLDLDYLESRLSSASLSLIVHFENIPPSGSNRLGLFNDTLHQGAWCHRSLWAELKHQESREEHWKSREIAPGSSTIQLNEIEEKFWRDRWSVGALFKLGSSAMKSLSLILTHSHHTVHDPRP